MCIDPFNLQEDQGTQVGFQLFDSLTQYDFEKGEMTFQFVMDHYYAGDYTVAHVTYTK